MKHFFNVTNLLAVLLFTTVNFTASASNYPVTVKSCGEDLTFQSAPQKAIFHDLNMTEMALALDLQANISAVTGITGWYTPTANFLEQLGDIPEIAPKGPALEVLIANKPDFFFAGWNYGMRVGGNVTPQRLAEYNIPTLLLSESCAHMDKTLPAADLNLLYQDIEKLGAIFDKRDKSAALVKHWQERIAAITTKVATKKPLNVFLYDSGEDKPFTSGRFAMPDAMMRAAGGRNIMDNLNASWATTSWENVASANPDFIILLDYGNAGDVDKLKNFLAKHPLMQYTKAVRNQRYLALQYAELTPGPANIPAIERLASALYPELF